MKPNHRKTFSFLSAKTWRSQVDAKFQLSRTTRGKRPSILPMGVRHICPGWHTRPHRDLFISCNSFGLFSLAAYGHPSSCSRAQIWLGDTEVDLWRLQTGADLHAEVTPPDISLARIRIADVYELTIRPFLDEGHLTWHQTFYDSPCWAQHIINVRALSLI